MHIFRKPKHVSDVGEMKDACGILKANPQRSMYHLQDVGTDD
jgi:hypothetical protein